MVVPPKTNGDHHPKPHSPSGGGGTSSRWPKAEVEALINLRTSMDPKYQENGPKGPLWEEISAAMKKRGYNRSAKRCKEKWENINKYFKKVKESHRRRREDSKTCPYFDQLDAIYREKNKLDTPATAAAAATTTVASAAYGGGQMKQQPENAETGQNPVQLENEDQEESEYDEEDEEEEEEGSGGYEIVANNASGGGSMSSGSAAVATTTATTTATAE